MKRTAALTLGLMLGLTHAASAGTVTFRNCSSLAMADIKVFDQTALPGSPASGSALGLRVGAQQSFSCATALCAMTVNYRVRTGWNESAIRGVLDAQLPDGGVACLKPDPSGNNDPILETSGSGCSC